jgi:hypothetical protein
MEAFLKEHYAAGADVDEVEYELLPLKDKWPSIVLDTRCHALLVLVVLINLMEFALQHSSFPETLKYL